MERGHRWHHTLPEDLNPFESHSVEINRSIFPDDNLIEESMISGRPHIPKLSLHDELSHQADHGATTSRTLEDFMLTGEDFEFENVSNESGSNIDMLDEEIKEEVKGETLFHE